MTYKKLTDYTLIPNKRAHIHADLCQNGKQYTIKQINNFSANKTYKVLYFYAEMVVKSFNELF